ncbi:MAG: hypothetical protein GXP04_07200 [Alphaproteobacteria bacterium]|nr:hypothetical protein [Alphaproteobacteria bacterium]
MIKKLLLASCGAIALGACGTTGGGNGRYDTQQLPLGQLTAAPFAINNNPLDRIDLLSMIDPENRRAALRSEGLCETHNASPPRIRGYARDKTRDAVGLYIDTLRKQYGDLTEKLKQAPTEKDKVDLRAQIESLADRIYKLELNNRKDPSIIRKNSSRSIDDMRRDYIAERYQYVTNQLLKEDKEKERKKLRKEKENLEEEAAKLGSTLDGDGGVNPSIELNCALFAFYTYYLSYPQFTFAINDLSYYLDNDYLNFKALIPDLTSSEFDSEAGVNNLRDYVARLSEFEQQRLKSYLSTGLYDKFFEQAAKSIAISMRRNSIQDQIMVHSENYCRYFKAKLHDTDIKVNLGLGLASTVLSGLATIFTDPTTVRALAGAAGITSGSQSRYNEVMFANLAVQTVIAGIDLSREKLLREINGYRFFPLDKDDIDEFKGLENDGVLNPGMFNTYGLRTSIPWDNLYGEENGQLTYAGHVIPADSDKIANLGYQPPVFTFSELISRAALQQEGASVAETEVTTDTENNPPIALPMEKKTKEDTPVEIDVLKAVSDPDEQDADNLTIDQSATSALSGTVAVIEDGKKLRYTPRTNFRGKDVIRYTVKDGRGGKALGFVEVTIEADGEKSPTKKYLGLASIGVYSVEAAMRDAIRFQTSCSLAAGLTQATEAMEQARAPSVETLTNSLKDMEGMMRATEQLRRAIDDAAAANKTNP